MFTLKGSNFLFCFFIVLTGCCPTACKFPDAIELPCYWQTDVQCNVTAEDPACFRWWEGFQDARLTALIEDAACRNPDVLLAASQSRANALHTVNDVAAEVATAYIQLRGSQMRQCLLQRQVEAQEMGLKISSGLTEIGLLDAFEHHDSQINLDNVIAQKNLVDLSIKKAIFHLSVLLGYPPGDLFCSLCQPQEIPTLPCCFPIGTPVELIQRQLPFHGRCALDCLCYRKKVLNLLEETETALAMYQSDLAKVCNAENTKRLREESYQMTLDLYQKGKKNDSDLLKARQALLIEEDLLIQSKVDLLTDYVKLYKALSAGWEM